MAINIQQQYNDILQTAYLKFYNNGDLISTYIVEDGRFTEPAFPETELEPGDWAGTDAIVGWWNYLKNNFGTTSPIPTAPYELEIKKKDDVVKIKLEIDGDLVVHSKYKKETNIITNYARPDIDIALNDFALMRDAYVKFRSEVRSI